MDKCYTCIHSNVCDWQHAPRYVDIVTNEKGCAYYKNRDCMIESPCPIGTTIYIRRKMKDGGVWVQPVTVVGLHLKDTEDYRGAKREEYLVARGAYGFSKHIPFNKIGKEVFFSEEEAKQGCCNKEIRDVRYCSIEKE